MQSLSYHRITGLQLTAITHYPAEPGRHGEFWKREIIVHEGDEAVSIPLFSDTADGLITDQEKVGLRAKVRANTLTNIQPIPVTIR